MTNHIMDDTNRRVVNAGNVAPLVSSMKPSGPVKSGEAFSLIFDVCPSLPIHMIDFLGSSPLDESKEFLEDPSDGTRKLTHQGRIGILRLSNGSLRNDKYKPSYSYFARQTFSPQSRQIPSSDSADCG